MHQRHLSMLVVGLVVSVVSIGSAFFKVHNWYLPAVIGVWLIFDYFACQGNSRTTFQLLKKNPLQFLQIYVLLFFLACSIELVGRFILKWWTYPNIHGSFHEIVLLVFYPFILFSFREMYNVMHKVAKSKLGAFLLSMAMGITIWEIPNMYSRDWTYTIPYFNWSIFQLPLIIIVGWAALIGLPLYVYSAVLRDGSRH
jgi:hypothetical protein